MKLVLFFSSLFLTTSVLALDEYVFNCPMPSGAIVSLPGIKQAPDNPVVGLNIKVLKSEVPLYLIKANFTEGDALVTKDLFVTDWVKPDTLSTKGTDLLSLLALFYDVDIANVQFLRAAIPANLLEDFAYLELQDKSNAVKKLGFKGIEPTECK